LHAGVAQRSRSLLTCSTGTTTSRELPKRQKAIGPASKPKPRKVTRVPPVVTPPGGPPFTVTWSIRRP
jgi:hypothetical protein